MWYRESISTESFTMDPQPRRRSTCTIMTTTTMWLQAWLRFWVASTSVQTVTKVITPKKNTLATTYVIIVGRFTIKLKMIGYIVKIVDDTSKDQNALISTRRRHHWETQRAPLITNVRTADKPWTNEREIIPVETSIARLVKIIIHLDTSVTCYLWITTIDRRNRLTSFFDFECTQDDRIQCQQGYQSDDNETCMHCKSPRCGAFDHKPNLCVVHRVCLKCMDQASIKTVSAKHVGRTNWCLPDRTQLNTFVNGCFPEKTKGPRLLHTISKATIHCPY